MNVDEHTLKRITEAVKRHSNERGNKNLGHNELEELASEIIGEEVEDRFRLESFSFSGDTEEDTEGTCSVKLKINGEEAGAESSGGVVDAARQVVEELTGFELNIQHWDVTELEGGSDAKVGITANIAYNGYELDIFTESKISENAGVDALMQAANIFYRLEERAQGEAELEKAA